MVSCITFQRSDVMKDKGTWYWIDIPYACGGIRFGPDGHVNKTPPIFRWMKGKDVGTIIAWVTKHKGQMERLDGT